MLSAAVKPDRDPRRTRSTQEPGAVNRSGRVAPTMTVPPARGLPVRQQAPRATQGDASSVTNTQNACLRQVGRASASNRTRPSDGLLRSRGVTGIQPELWVDRPSAAVEFYRAAFGAAVLHHVGQGDDIVVQLAVGDAAFWVTAASPDRKRFSPESIGGATGRTLLIVDDPSAVLEQAVTAGARKVAAVIAEHGWQLGRIVDPFGHEWEIGRPLGVWPPQ